MIAAPTIIGGRNADEITLFDGTRTGISAAAAPRTAERSTPEARRVAP
jgi:hypothetical protein